ncbi:amidohydrolase family protein [Flavisolibacter ginsenosidimutans]|uniref:Amidohydrolase family protein n=1 Tax=Flavisolibacter ginsenosidimutans TaxID=661481 RepID=A0A5B8UEJ6_9BACT|nr:amidohydrolase family protein [Flavisolibacter ginsenosidimutans]QEC54549.1 amidohydrolase family protein [Flavisolibacter ginsenosidimutans]
MKKIFLSFSALCFLMTVRSQETIAPAPKQSQPIVITNATIHVGNGQVINNGSIVVVNGKITAVGASVTPPAGAKTIDAQGKQVYPGLILANSNLGLVDVNSVRATSDVREIGDMNASIRSIIAYNAENKVINTLRPSGILLAQVAPEGGMLSGSSSVVQLDAWNWEDAAYKTDNGLHFNMPSFLPRPRFGFGGGGGRGAGGEAPADPVKEALEKIDGFKAFLREAKAYNGVKKPEETNLKYEAVKGLFDRSQKLFVHASTVKQILVAVDMAKEFNLDMVIVGGEDSWQVADLLKQNNISVILSQPHSLPILPDDDVDQPYKTAALLQKAGVNFAINDDDGQTRGRNLPFNAGTAVAYGLTKEQALAAISLNAAKILGVGDKTGSIEVGKDANIVISTGDILDMRTNNITQAFIQGREISLESHQTQLYDKYKKKLGVKDAF